MLHFVSWLSLAIICGLTQAYLHDRYSGIPPFIKAPKIKRSHFNIANSYLSGERYSRESNNRHNSHFYPWYDKTNYLINRAVDSKTLDSIKQLIESIQTDREFPEKDNIKRMVHFPNEQEVLLRKLFDKNRRGSLDLEQQNLNGYYDEYSKHSLDNNKLSNIDQNYLTDKENQRVRERFKEYDSASPGESNKDFEEINKLNEELVEPKHKHKNSLMDKENSNPSQNSEKSLLFRKTSRTEYLVRNDKGVFDFLDKEMPSDIYSVLKNFRATATHDLEVQTDMADIAPKMSSYNHKAENSNIPNGPAQKTGNKNIPNESEEQTNPEINAFKVKDNTSQFTNDIMPNEVTNDSANKDSNNSNYEYYEEEDDQYIPQTEIFYGVYSGGTSSDQPGNKDFSLNEATEYRVSTQKENDKEESNSGLLDYELGKPITKPHIIPSQKQLLDSSSTSTLQIAKQAGQDVATTIEEMTKVSTTISGNQLIENESSRNNAVHLDSYRTTADPYLETIPQGDRPVGYDQKHPPVLQHSNEVDKETDLKRILMHIRPPHTMKPPEIRHRRKLKVSAHQEVAADSPINQNFRLRRKRRQIDVDRRSIIDQQTKNVPADDCCFNGGTCFMSHLTPGKATKG